jgi:hypothetical protein
VPLLNFPLLIGPGQSKFGKCEIKNLHTEEK